MSFIITLLLLICRRKSLSTTLSMMMTFSIAFLQLIVISSFGLGVANLNKLISLCRQSVEHPIMAQFSPELILSTVCCVFLSLEFPAFLFFGFYISFTFSH